MSLRRKTQSSSNLIIEQPFQQRQWLKRRGKDNRIQLNDQMIQKLKEYFSSLDQDNSATVSPAQLEDPLILFGLCKNRQDVEEIFKEIDFDGSGQLQFREFLEVFRRVGNECREARLCKRNLAVPNRKKFKQFTNTLLGMENRLQSNISFRLGMSVYRRRHLLNALTSKDNRQKSQGKIILQKFEEQVRGNPLTNSRLKEQRSANLECLPVIPAIRIRPVAHRRIRTVI